MIFIFVAFMYAVIKLRLNYKPSGDDSEIYKSQFPDVGVIHCVQGHSKNLITRLNDYPWKAIHKDEALKWIWNSIIWNMELQKIIIEIHD